jgi:hypothetical protein
MTLNQKGNAPIIAIATLVIGALLGAGIGYSMGSSNNNDDVTVNNSETTSHSTVPTTDTAAADTRVALNAALREHVSLAGEALRAVFDGAPQADAAVAELDNNSVEVAGIVGSVYGEEAEASFLSLWRNHIGFFASYTTSAKAGDQAGMDQALLDLEGYGTDAAAFFAAANPNLPADAVKPLLVMHRDHVIEAVNAYGAKDYAKSYAAEAEAYDQIGTIADAIASAVVKQNPDSF